MMYHCNSDVLALECLVLMFEQLTELLLSMFSRDCMLQLTNIS